MREWEGETGLYDYRARYYGPEIGRFLSADPIGFASGDTNLYAYVGNSPISFTDPLGLQKGNPDFCKRLLEKIGNVSQRIRKRIGELKEEPLGLPESCPLIKSSQV